MEIFDRLKNSIDFLNRFALFRLDFSSDFLPIKRAILTPFILAGGPASMVRPSGSSIYNQRNYYPKDEIRLCGSFIGSGIRNRDLVQGSATS